MLVTRCPLQAGAFFSWLASELSSLPDQERRVVLMLPVELVDRVRRGAWCKRIG